MELAGFGEFPCFRSAGQWYPPTLSLQVLQGGRMTPGMCEEHGSMDYKPHRWTVEGQVYDPKRS